MRIGVIGTGVIASAVVEGIASDGHDIAVSARSAENAARLAARFANVAICSNAQVLAESDVIFLGLMAEAATEILSALNFRADQRVISLMAGASLAEVAAMVAPGHAEAVMIPFPGIAQGGSPILLRGDAGLVREIFGGANTVYPLDTDADLAAYLCAQAVLSPAAKMVSDAAEWLGSRVRDSAQAEGFLRNLVGSSLLASDLAPLLRALSTPGGYNARLRDHMDGSGMTETLGEGLDHLATQD